MQASIETHVAQLCLSLQLICSASNAVDMTCSHELVKAGGDESALFEPSWILSPRFWGFVSYPSFSSSLSPGDMCHKFNIGEASVICH